MLAVPRLDVVILECGASIGQLPHLPIDHLVCVELCIHIVVTVDTIAYF